MDIVIWKSYGDISVYEADTPEKLAGIIRTVVSCIVGWKILDKECTQAIRIVDELGHDLKSLRITLRDLIHAIGEDHENFEWLELTRTQVTCK